MTTKPQKAEVIATYGEAPVSFHRYQGALYRDDNGRYCIETAEGGERTFTSGNPISLRIADHVWLVGRVEHDHDRAGYYFVSDTEHWLPLAVGVWAGYGK